MNIAIFTRPDDLRLDYLLEVFTKNNLSINLAVMAKKKRIIKASTKFRGFLRKFLIPNKNIKKLSFYDNYKGCIYWTSDHSNDDVKKKLEEFKIDLVFLSAAGIIRKKIINGPWKIVNCHPAILPRYRGKGSCEWAVYNGGPLGITAHYIDAGIDTGPIIYREYVKPKACETIYDYRKRLDLISVEIIAIIFRKIVEKENIQVEYQQKNMGVLYKRKPLTNEMPYIINAFEKLKEGSSFCL